MHVTETEGHRDTNPTLEPVRGPPYTRTPDPPPQQEGQWHQGAKLTTLPGEQEEEKEDQPGHRWPHQVQSEA